MRLATTLAAVLAATALGCGTTADLIYIVDVVPFAGVSGALTSDVDTSVGVCVGGIAGSICKPEPVGDHFARIKVANDFTPDSDNPAFGRRVINRFQLQLSALNEAGIQFPEVSANTRVVLEPGTETYVTLILADQVVISAIDTDPAELYEARYTLSGPDGLSIFGSAVVSIGNFNSCEEGLSASPHGQC